MKCQLCGKEIESHESEINLNGWSSMQTKVKVKLKVCHHCFYGNTCAGQRVWKKGCKMKTLLISLILLCAGQAGAEEKPYLVTWQMEEAVRIPCPDTWIDDYGRINRRSGCTVNHTKWVGPYTGERYFASLDNAIGFIKEKQKGSWGYPQQRFSDFKIIYGEAVIEFPKPEVVIDPGVTPYTIIAISGETIYIKSGVSSTQIRRTKP